jgi:hypothetical protein
MLFMYWLYYGLIWLIEILLSNILVTRNGVGGLAVFAGVKIVAEIMRFIADGLMMGLDAPDNIIGRGHVAALNEVFNVNFPMNVQKTKHILEFYMTFGNGVSLPHRMNFSYLHCAWDAANLILRDLLTPGQNRSVNLSGRNCPICLDPILLQSFGIPACGHPIHGRCSIGYKNQMVVRSRVVRCPICQFDTQGCCY